jgi:hypothetical protein
MEAKEIYLKIKREITKGLYAYDDQIAAIAKWVESEFEVKKKGEKLPIHNVMDRLPESDEIRRQAQQMDEKDFDQWWWETVYKGN